eukprot:16442982-Heterocapsa_arctica.AAC.2
MKKSGGWDCVHVVGHEGMTGDLEDDRSVLAAWRRNLREAGFSATLVFEPENFHQLSRDWPGSGFTGYLLQLQRRRDLVGTMPALAYKLAIDGFTGRAEEYPSLAESKSSRGEERNSAVKATWAHARKLLAAALGSRPSLGEGQRLMRSLILGDSSCNSYHLSNRKHARLHAYLRNVGPWPNLQAKAQSGWTLSDWITATKELIDANKDIMTLVPMVFRSSMPTLTVSCLITLTVPTTGRHMPLWA